MKKLVSRFLGVSLAIAMIITMAGCGSSEKAAESTSTAVAAASSTQAATTAEQTQEKEKVTVTIYTGPGSANYQAGVQTDPVAKEIEKLTGVTMDVTPQGSVGDYNTKITAMAASGDLPDLFYTSDDNMRKTLIDSQQIIDMTDLVKTNGQDIQSNFTFKLKHSSTLKSNGTGKLYFMPLYGGDGNDPFQPSTGQYIRWDYYKELGYPKADTFDDIINVLTDMVKKHPTTPDGQKAYALSGWFGDTWGGFNLNSHANREGLSDWGKFYIDITTMTMAGCTYTDKNSPTWISLKFYNEAKRRGILDPDCLTQKYAQFADKLKAGRVYFMSAPFGEYVDATGNTGFAPLPPKEGSDRYMVRFLATAGQNNYAISKQCKNPDRVMDLLDFFCTADGAELIYNGIKGTDWDLVNGKPELKDETLNVIKTDPDYSLKTGICKYSEFSGFGVADVDTRYNTPVNLQYTPEALEKRLTNVTKDYCQHFNVQYPGQAFQKVKYDTFDASVGDGMALPDDEMNTLATKLNEYFNKNCIKAILAKDDSEFDQVYNKIVKDMKDMGVDKWYTWAQKAWADSKATIDTMK